MAGIPLSGIAVPPEATWETNFHMYLFVKTCMDVDFGVA